MSGMSTYGVTADRQVNVVGEEYQITAAAASAASYAMTIPNYARSVSINTAASLTLTLPEAPVRGQSLFVSWTMSALGVILFKQGSVYVWVSPSYFVSATGNMSFTYDGAVWRAAKPMPGITTAISPSGAVRYGSIVTPVANSTVVEVNYVANTGANGPIYVVPMAGALEGTYANDATVPLIPWGTEDVHTCVHLGTSGTDTIALCGLVMVATTGTIVKYATDGFVVGKAAATVAEQSDGVYVNCKIIPCAPYRYAA